MNIGRPAVGFRDGCRELGVAVGRDFPPMEKTWARISLGRMEDMEKAVPVFKKVLGKAYRFRQGYGAAGRPIAKSVETPRTYMTPSESAGVAISISPIEFVAMCLNEAPASTTSISPSSFDR